MVYDFLRPALGDGIFISRGNVITLTHIK